MKIFLKIIMLLLCSAVIFYNCGLKTKAYNEMNQVFVTNSEELINALSDAKAGDEIILREGIYTNDKWIGIWAVFYADADGTAENPIILRSEDPENPATIMGESFEEKVALRINGDYWQINNLKICQAAKGIFLEQSEHSTISECEVYDIGEEAIHIIDNSSYNLVENCYIHNAGLRTPEYGEGVYIGSSYKTEEYGHECHYNTVRGCRIGPDITADHVDIKEYTIGNIVEECIFDGTGIQGLNGGNSFVEVKGNNCIIRNNTGYRNNNDKVLYAFDANVQIDGWGQNNKIYDNTVYMDTADCSIFKEWMCSSMVFRNKAYPEDVTYSCSQTLQVKNFYLRGDTTEDGKVNTEDIKCLQNYMLNREIRHISEDNSDINSDSDLNVFDLCTLKKKIIDNENTEKPVISVDYIEEETAKWRITDGLGGRTVTFNLTARPDSILNVGWGYWDGNYANEDGTTGKWFQFSEGNFTADKNGNVTVITDIPNGMRRVMLEIYDYSYSDGILDKDEVELVKVITD